MADDILVHDLKKSSFNGTTSTFESGSGVTRMDQHAHWINNIPVTPKLYAFAKAVQREMPWVTFGFGSASTYANDYCARDFIHVGEGAKPQVHFTELIAYVPGQRYALGRIGFRDYGVKETRYTYGVWSRKIVNKKIGSRHLMHKMSLSTDLARAVKAAVKYFVPYSAIEMAKLSYENFRSNFKSTISEARSSADKFIDACACRQVLVAELTNLIRQEVKFVTPQFTAAAAEYLSAAEEAQQINDRKVLAYYVTLGVTPSAPKRTIAYVSEVNTNVRDLSHVILNSTQEVLMDNLPEDIQAKLAVLMSIEDSSYVPGVGYREDENAYWLERPMQ